MSQTARDLMEEIVEEMEMLEEIVGEQEIELAEKNDYIEQLTSPQQYVTMIVVILMSYLYGAWFGVYMCPK
jgi:hypothetical protein